AALAAYPPAAGRRFAQTIRGSAGVRFSTLQVPGSLLQLKESARARTRHEGLFAEVVRLLRDAGHTPLSKASISRDESCLDRSRDPRSCNSWDSAERSDLHLNSWWHPLQPSSSILISSPQCSSTPLDSQPLLFSWHLPPLASTIMTTPARSSSREIPVHHRSNIPTSLSSPRSSFISLALLTPSALFLPLRGVRFGSAAVAFGIGPGSLASAGEKEHSSGGP
ncbi:MAG: hypothetical protein SGPRY_014839, partial [Prymnesium sp.]